MKEIVFYTLLFLSGVTAGAQHIPRPNIKAQKGLQVNSFTGNIIYQRNELMVKGKGFSTNSLFYYNTAGDTTDYGYGKGWSFYYHMFYRLKGDTVILQHGDTKKDTFLLQSGVYYSPPGVFDTLIKTGNQFILETKNKVRYVFADDISKKITGWIDPNGNFLSFIYESNNLSKITNTSGKYLILKWEGDHLQSITDSNATVKTYSYLYDVNNDLVRVTDPLGSTLNFSYDKHKLISLIDENNNPILITYSSSGKVKKIISCNSEQQFTFLEALRRTFVSESAAAGNMVTGYEFDEMGRLISFTNPLKNTMRFAYDTENNLTEWNDFNGSTIFYDYDANGNMIKETDAKGSSSEFTYENNFNKVSSIKNKKGDITNLTYDIKGNLTLVQHPDGATETYGYDAGGQLTSYTNQRNHTTSFEYNADGQLVTINYPIGTQLIEYNGSCCNATKITDPNGNTIETVYDNLNRPLSVKDGLNHTITYEYDAGGNRVKETDPNGVSKTFGYDALNRLTRVTLPVGDWRYEYDGQNNLLSMTDANGNISSYAYDIGNRLISERDALGNTTTYEYDANGNLRSKKTPNGNTTFYKYDENNRLTERSYDGNTDEYSYDENGNLASAYNNNITYTFTYDELNRLLKKDIINWSKNISYTYDEAGNRSTMTDHDGGMTQYAYDVNNRLTALTDPSNLTTNFIYDAGGRLLRQNNPNNTFTTWHYDDAGRIDNIENLRTNGDTISFFKYTFDNFSNRKTMRDKYGLHIYNYDSSYRLVNVTYPDASLDSFILDATGNRTQRIQNGIPTAYTYNNADQLQAAGSSSFAFDANGNMTQQSDSILRKYRYDGEDRLNEILMGQKKVEFRYDPFGEKIERLDTNNVVTKMVYDEGNLLCELNNANVSLTRYITGFGMDSWLSMRSEGNIYYYHKDGLNSTTELTGSSAQMVNVYKYDAYGSILNQSVSINNNMLYAGRLYEGSIGLYDCRARFYNAEIGRFLNKDLIVGNIYGPLSLNRYSYVRHNPINYFDPNGLNPVLAFSIGFALGYNADEMYKDYKQSQEFSQTDDHTNRNYRNQVPPDDLNEAKKQGWQKEKWYKNIFHPGDKYILPDKEGEGSSEAIRDGGRWLKCGEKGGPTYNYYHPGSSSSSYQHLKYDVLPHFMNEDYKCPPKPPFGPQEPPSGPGADDPATGGFPIFVPIIRSGDPNEIIGPAGYDPVKKWVSIKAKLPYKILFENDPEFATAPAQRITIYMPIDPKINPASLQLGDFGFGSFVFPIEPNTTVYSKRLNVSDSLGVFVDVTAGLDITNRRAFWVFESIDTATGLTNTVPASLGILPVNDSIKGNGEGFVTLNILPSAFAQTLDSISASASIIFDTEETIATNTWVNIIDAVAPTSQLNTLPALVDSVFTISWTGADDSLGAGIRDYALYYSKNNGPYILYRKNIDSTHLLFKGENGATYSFYTIATDNTGNEELPKTAGEQTVTVKGNGLFVSIKAFLQGGYNPSTGLMIDSLRTMSLLSATEPYRLLGFTPVNNPTAEAAKTGVLDSTESKAITDWIWLELRNSSNPSLIVATRSALIRRDGNIVDMDGHSPVYFNNTAEGNYYIALRHRNHFGIMTAAALNLSKTDTLAIDFTNPATATYGTNARRNLSGIMVMWAGDISKDGKIKYNGSSNDKVLILSKVGVANPNNVLVAYDATDLNLDGKVKYNGSANDKTIILNNVGITTPNNVLTEQLPN